jgi:putrescine aminotransferase
MSSRQQKATSEWQSLDSRHYLHPFTDFHGLGQKGSRIITRAEGVYIYDSEGNRILDGMAGLWCVNLGYGRKDLAEVACRQMQELTYYSGDPLARRSGMTFERCSLSR